MFFDNRPYSHHRHHFMDGGIPFGGFSRPSYGGSSGPFFDGMAFPATEEPYASFHRPSTVDKDPFQGRDYIPINVTHEYTNKSGGSRESTPPPEPTKTTEVKVPQPHKSTSEEAVPPAGEPRKPHVHQKPSSAGVRTVPIRVDVEEEPPRKKTPPPKPEPKPVDPKQISLDKIAAVEAALAELAPSVEAFSGQRGCKDYLYLDEMLTRNLIKLDDVETLGDDEIRAKRKEVVRKIQGLVEKLEANIEPKAVGEKEMEAKVEAVESETQEGEEPMETAENQKEPEEAKTDEKEDDIKMEEAAKEEEKFEEGAKEETEDGRPEQAEEVAETSEAMGENPKDDNDANEKTEEAMETENGEKPAEIEAERDNVSVEENGV